MQKSTKHKSFYSGCIGKNPLNCLIFVLAVMFLLSGCSTLTSLNPVGTNPLYVEEDDWAGVWYSDGVSYGSSIKEPVVCFVMVKDKDKGTFRVAFIQGHKDQDMKYFIVRKLDVQLREGRSGIYGNILLKDYAKEDQIYEINEDTYVWFKVERSEDSIFIQLPDPRKVEELGKQGKLDAKIGIGHGCCSGGNIVISEPTQRITEFIDSTEPDQLFGWHTLTFRRLVKDDPITIHPISDLP